MVRRMLIISGISLGALFLLPCFLKLADAQQTSPQFLFTWRADSFAPSDFRGKVFPTLGTRITASFELVTPTGAIANLANTTVYWYLNDKLITSQQGLHTVHLRVSELGTQTLRLEIPNYSSGALYYETSLPVVQPEVVIAWPSTTNQFSSPTFTVSARPFFFNITDPIALTYAWHVNDRAPQNIEDPQTLKITLAPTATAGTPVYITLSAQNPKASAESANQSLTLTYTPQF